MSFSSLPLSPKILDSSRRYSSRFTRHLAYSNTRVPTKFPSEARAYNSLLLLSSRPVLYLAASSLSYLFSLPYPHFPPSIHSFQRLLPRSNSTFLSPSYPHVLSLSFSRSLSCSHTHTRRRTTSLITTYFNTIRRRVTPTIEGITINA